MEFVFREPFIHMNVDLRKGPLPGGNLSMNWYRDMPIYFKLCNNGANMNVQDEFQFHT